MVYIHSRTITLPTISGESLAKEIKEKFGVQVINYRQEMSLKFGPLIRSVHISPPAVTKRFNFTKYHIDNHINFKNFVISDESWFVLGKNSRMVCVDKHQITDRVLQNKMAPQKK